MKKFILITVFAAVILITGCYSIGYANIEGQSGTDDKECQVYIETIRETGCECMNRTSNFASAEEQEAWKAFTIERSSTYNRYIRNRYDLIYLIRENFVPAACDTDLQTIERFIFYHGTFWGGFGIAIDRMHGMVYYDPHEAGIVTRIRSVLFSAEFIEEDLSRLIRAINESGLREWQEYYAGEFDDYKKDGGSFWAVGILFSDGTILRRGGSGDINYLPPENEFAILTDFVRTLGAEIRERHALTNE